MKLLITGSRDASRKMLHVARRIVRATKWDDEFYPSLLGCEIVVGDASGIDDEVVITCRQYGVTYSCYGITQTPRNSAHIHFYDQVSGDFLSRDRVMVEQCDLCIAIWNGVSRGTKYTYDYAVKLGKKARLLTP